MSEDIIGLIFSLCWLGAVAFVWYLMFFKGYAKKWGRDIIQFQKNLGLYSLKNYYFIFFSCWILYYVSGDQTIFKIRKIQITSVRTRKRRKKPRECQAGRLHEEQK